MKTIFLSLLFITSYAFAQKTVDTTGLSMFNKGLDFYNEGKLDSTIAVWTYMVENKVGKKYDTYGNAFFNIPTVYWQMKEYDKAKTWYKRILDSDLKDSDETGSLMEPHTNYKHKSAAALAGLYAIDSNYVEALKWLDQADTVYRYWGFEGSATNVSLEQAYMLDWKVELLLNLKRKEEAIRAIVIELICAGSLETFFEKSETQLLGLVDKKQFKADLDKAINELTIKNINANNWMVSFNLHGLPYQIPVSNVYPDRNLPHYWRMIYMNKTEAPDKKYIVDEIKERSFYKAL